MTKLVKKKRSPSGSQDLGSKNAVAWSVEFLNDSVRGEFRALDADVKAGIGYVMNLMVEVGIMGVGGPHVGHLRGKVWEIRAEGKKQWGRALYCTQPGKRVIILRCFAKKTNKTPPREISLAEERMKQIKN